MLDEQTSKRHQVKVDLDFESLQLHVPTSVLNLVTGTKCTFLITLENLGTVGTWMDC